VSQPGTTVRRNFACNPRQKRATFRPIPHQIPHCAHASDAWGTNFRSLLPPFSHGYKSAPSRVGRGEAIFPKPQKVKEPSRGGRTQFARDYLARHRCAPTRPPPGREYPTLEGCVSTEFSKYRDFRARIVEMNLTAVDPMRTSANVGYGEAEWYRVITEPTSRATNSAQARYGSLMFNTSPSG
jgi:hypothetical protein